MVTVVRLGVVGFDGTETEMRDELQHETNTLNQKLMVS